MKGSLKSPWILVILLVLGGIIGSFLGSLLGDQLPILNEKFLPIGLDTTTIDLIVVSITFGVIVKLNMASLIGFIIALIIYFRI